MSLILLIVSWLFARLLCMKRLSYIAIFLAGSLLTAHAQRGVGARVSISSPSRVGAAFASRPAPSGIAPHSIGFVPGRTIGTAGPRAFAPSRAFTPNRAFAPRPAFAPRGGVRISVGFNRGFGRRFRDFDGDFDDFRFRHRRPFFFGGFGGGCFNGFDPFCNNAFFGNSFGFGGPFGFGSTLGYAGYPLDYGSQPPPPQQVVVEPDNNNRQLSLEVERLSDEVSLLREEDLRLRNDARNDGRRAGPPQPQGSLSAQQPPEYTVLVFHDGRKVSVQNYAIAGSTLWIIDERAARKVPLSDLDLSATEQANSVNGVQFKGPSQSH